MLRLKLIAALTGILVVLASGNAHACASYTGARFADAVVRSAVEVRSGSVVTPQQQRIDGLPVFCRVVLGVDPVLADSATGAMILIEVWMPAASVWNGRFLGTGNGSFAGAIRYDALAMGLQRGFAVANTDMGTHRASIIQERS